MSKHFPTLFGPSIPLPDFEDTIEIRPKPKKNCLLRTKSCNFADKAPLILPIIDKTDAVPRITKETMNDLLHGKYHEYFEKLFIIDCRFPYEFNGGHIKGAMNCNSPTTLFDNFFNQITKGAIIVFHCEFSQSRGPTMAGLFREHDRSINWSHYPYLHYPDVYILDDGYKGFYEKYLDNCDGGYIRMHTQEYVDNGDLQHYHTVFQDEIEKINEKKREALLPPSKSSCPFSPLSNQRKKSCLLDSPVATKKRCQ
ncbi:Rhodanese-like domain containing protein [Trichomonas vaginalis G3]|uniref:protein-tyrosine-phosphatase n=1 Tax=Trichomonas vaginalis (strain ATCC PRA-98 / G3) TaxID=412133 RepID=A2G6G2_TRIV3|nr:Rhodanese-like domain containing protein [Trichomonas vaginalis G3]|eukprot:XP_001300188.1 Rhodanese-like domain containing protein [Trichomonas vaginalis G3]